MSTIKICPQCERFVNGDVSVCPSCGSDMVDSFVETSTWNAITPQERREIITRVTQGNTASKTAYSLSEVEKPTKKKNRLGCLVACLIVMLFFSISSSIYYKNHTTNKYGEYPTLGLDGFAFGLIESAEKNNWDIKSYDNNDGTTITYISQTRADGGLIFLFSLEYDKDGDPGAITFGCVKEQTQSLINAFEWVRDWQGNDNMYDFIVNNIGKSNRVYFGDVYVETSHNAEEDWVSVYLSSKQYDEYAFQVATQK